MNPWLRYFAFWRRNPRLDVDDEIRFHIDMRVRDLVARGVTPDAARREAEREFGDVTDVRGQVERIDSRIIRREGRAEWWSDLRRDVSVGARSLRHSPGFALTAIACAGLGIGVTAAIVSAAHAILVRPLPYRDAHELVAVYSEHAVRGYQRANVSWPDYLEWREQNRTLAALGIWTWASKTLSADDAEAERVNGAEVAANLFHLLGVQPARGRLFVDGEDGANAAPVVLLGDDLWKRRFAADTAIVGSTITIDGRAFTVVGIMPAGFSFPDRGEIWTPFSIDPANEEHGNRYHAGAIGRMRTGVTLAQARDDLHRIDADLERRFPDHNEGWRADVLSLRDDLVADLRRPIEVFLAAVALVLVMVCANLANLLLARGAARSREIAVRSALGATRGRLGRQLLAESLLIAGAGGVLGVAIAWWGVRLLRFAFPDQAPPFFIDLSLDGSAIGIVLAVTVLTGLLFGVVPAVRSTRVDLNSALRDGARGSGDSAHRARLRGMLVTAEVALSVVLMVGALLLVRSYRNLAGTDLGFAERGVVTARLTLPAGDFPRASIDDFYVRLLERMRAVPGVEYAGSAQGIPFSGWNVQSRSAVEGMPPARRGEEIVSHFQVVTPDYFKAIGVPLVRGRWLRDADRDTAAPVALVNEVFVRRFFGDADPIGRRVRTGAARQFATIVGVVADFRHYRLPQPMGPATYYPFAAWPTRSQTIALKVRDGDAAALIPVLRQAVRELSPRVALYQVQTLEEVVSRSLWRQRLQGNVLTIFAALALALACIGLYGVISYAVAQRTREMGVRLALGASGADILRLVFGQSARLVSAGVVLGVFGALAAVRLLDTLLYGVRPRDPATFIAVTALLALVGLLAALIPARRAALVDPMIAMRSE